MTRKFFKFVKTHPRKGKVERNIAFIEGRYAAPFNGFICGSEQTPDYAVWGRFGNDAPEWGHRQPEKCRQILDVLMPGASTHPLRQRFDKRRFYFSGTPYGDFDEVPVEVNGDYLKQYKLLLNLGWNTMIAEDYEKILDFVKDGGVLFTGLPQFSTHVKRDFLKEMKDLALWNNGDLKELCGIEVNGTSDRQFVSQFNTALDLPEAELSAIPSADPDEDGNCFIADCTLSADAEVVVWDADSGLPLLVRNKCGKGVVYTLTVYAYPGHERIRNLSAAVTAFLAGESRSDIRVEDESGEVFWSVRRESGNVARLNMLNTDWSRKGNVKVVTVFTPGVVADIEVVERNAAMLTVLPFALVKCGIEHFIEVVECGTETAKLRIHGSGDARITVYRAETLEEIIIEDNNSIVRELELFS